jgi:hypothetical protein
MQTVYILVMVWTSSPMTAPVSFPTLEACQKAGTAWVQEAKKLRGPAAGEFVCVPAEVAK